MLAGKWRLRCLWLRASPGGRKTPCARNPGFLLGAGAEALPRLRKRNPGCGGAVPALRSNFFFSAPGAGDRVPTSLRVTATAALGPPQTALALCDLPGAIAGAVWRDWRSALVSRESRRGE